MLRYASTVVVDDLRDQIEASESSGVVSEKLDTINKAGNASELLAEVLGVAATIPEWVEEELAGIVARIGLGRLPGTYSLRCGESFRDWDMTPFIRMLWRR